MSSRTRPEGSVASKPGVAGWGLPGLAFLALLLQPTVSNEAPDGSQAAFGLAAQEPSARRAPAGRELSGVPALNYDSDEGFGYGAVLALYDYGAEGLLPYRWTLQPTVFLTTKGHLELKLYFDTPHLLPGGWRLDLFLGIDNQIAVPYYGVGNRTSFEPEMAEGEDPYYYRYGRDELSVRANVQKPLGAIPVRIVIGGKASRFKLDPTPKDEGLTLLAEELGMGSRMPPSTYVTLRGGIVWDTRDHESQPKRGVWSEVLVERSDEALGSESSYTRLTAADRRYFSLGPRLVLANRLLFQDVYGRPPFFALQTFQSSFQPEEALGGAKSLRGILRNRFTGRGLWFWNAELRYHLVDFSLRNRPSHLVATAFVDSGRVWEEGIDLSSLLRELHHGIGSGLRMGVGPNFVVGVDFARSDEAGLQTYIGLGFLY